MINICPKGQNMVDFQKLLNRNKGNVKYMATLKQLAVESAENTNTKIGNIAELPEVDVNIDVVTKTFAENTDKEFRVTGFYGDNETFYRVPKSVMNQIGALIEETDFEKFRVIKTGSGMNTQYTVRIIE
jgi:esterase/lipase superfamily enzyme